MKWNAKDPAWSELTRVYLFSVKRARPHITVDEMAVLMFVFERTYGYKKEQERIPIRHFTDGVFKTDTEECVTTRVGISYVNLLRALRHLTAKGIIQVVSDPKNGSNWYNVTKPEHIDWKKVVKYVKENQASDLAKNNVVEAIWTGLSA